MLAWQSVSHSSLTCHEEAEGGACQEKQEKVEEDEACVAESACRKTGTRHRNGFQKFEAEGSREGDNRRVKRQLFLKEKARDQTDGKREQLKTNKIEADEKEPPTWATLPYSYDLHQQYVSYLVWAIPA